MSEEEKCFHNFSASALAGRVADMLRSNYISICFISLKVNKVPKLLSNQNKEKCLQNGLSLHDRKPMID